MTEVTITILLEFEQKMNFFEGCSWIQFNNLGPVLGVALKFNSSVAKGLKLKVRKFWGQIHTFVEVPVEKLVWSLFAPTPILVKLKQGITHLKTRLSFLNTINPNVWLTV